MDIQVTNTDVAAAANDMAANAASAGDHEAASIIKEAAEKLTGATPGNVETSGIAPEVAVDNVDPFAGVKLAAPAPVIVAGGSSGVTVAGVLTTLAKSAGGAILAYEVGRRLPDDMNPYVRILTTVTAATIGATAVGAAIDAGSGWFGKDTA
jgi:hypothetical protein